MSISRNQRRKKLKKRRIKLFVLTFLVLILGGAAYFAYDILSSAQKAAENIYEDSDDEKIKNIEVTNEPFNILLAGIDDQGGGKRSDVLMLVTVNPKTEKVYLLSIPRDTRTYVEELGYKTKINHSYSKGGIRSTVNTVSELLDIPIDFYITTDFEGFENIVDTFGGVTVDVPFTFEAQLTGSLKWKTFYEGPMELNGNEALAYVRMRKQDPMGDQGRNERQQQVIQELVRKASSITTVTKIDKIFEDLEKNVRTNIPPSKILSFVKLYNNIKDAEIERLTLEGQGDSINGVYYYIPDDESLTKVSTTLKIALNIDYNSGSKYGNGTSDDFYSQTKSSYEY